MKAEDLKGKTPDEMAAELLQLRKEAFNLRFQQASGQLENTARIRQVRRDWEAEGLEGPSHVDRPGRSSRSADR